MISSSFIKQYRIHLLLALVSCAFYISFAYDLSRTDYVKLLSLYVGLFFLFYKLKTISNSFKFLVVISVLFRLVFLLAIPNLSQDFYRFIWDGRMLLEGLNPYLITPESYIIKGEFPISQAQVLYEGMGPLSAGHFTNYPPISQFSFALAGLFTGKSILGSAIVIRILIIGADLGTLYFGKKLLEKFKIPVHSIFWYILNPFIIIELTGNLHFEGIMIFFLIWSLYLLHSGKWKWSAAILSLSVSVKLIPLMFLPLLFQKLGWKKSIGFYCIVGGLTILFFAPFYSTDFINNYAQTVGLWFQNFEFNASLYYIAREIGYMFRGWNEIAIIGKIIPLVVLVFVFLMTFFRKNKSTIQLVTALLFVLSFYFFASTTVHPWYIATILILSIFTKYKFPIIWSFVIILSYLAYMNSDSKENLWIVGLEYLIVYGVFIWEVFLKQAPKKLQHHQAI